MQLYVDRGQQLGMQVVSSDDGRLHVSPFAAMSVAQSSGAICEGDTILAIDDQRVRSVVDQGAITELEARRKLGDSRSPFTIKLTVLPTEEKPVTEVTAFWA